MITPTDLYTFPKPPPGKTAWPWEGQAALFPQKMSNGQSWPKLSIVTPSCNQGQFIEETIRSVLLQGYPNLEYLVIDGGSTDNSADIIRKYEPWLKYWVSETDAGQADAIEKGFNKASGDILAWQNSDDFYAPGAFERVAYFFAARADLVFANGDVNLVASNSQYVRRIYAMRPSHFFAANLGQHGWPQQGCFWLRSAYQHVGGVNPALQFCMDKDLFIRLVAFGPAGRITGPALANFRQHQQAKSVMLKQVARRETAGIVEKYGRKKWTKHPRLLQALWWVFRKQAALRLRLGRYFDWEY